MEAACTAAAISKLCVSTRMCRFLPLIFLPRSKPGGSIRAPFFGAFHALAVDDCRSRTSLPRRLLPALDVERMMQPGQGTVILPAAEIEVDGAASWQTLWHRTPMAAGAQPVEYLAHIDRAVFTARLGPGDLRTLNVLDYLCLNSIMLFWPILSASF